MRIVRCLTVGAAVFLVAGTSFAAQQSFTYSDAVCTYKVSYDPGAFDRARLEATVAFVTDTSPPLEFGPSLAKPAEAAAYDIGDYQSECGSREGLFWHQQFIDLPGIEDLRKQKIAELRDFCTMTQKKIEAAKGNVAALRDYTPAAPHCRRYVDALSASPDELRASWPGFVREFCRNNGDQKRCVGDHMAEARASDGDARMKLTLINYGWSNCANAHTLFNEGGEPGDSGSEKLRKSLFEALSRKVAIKTQSCAGED